MLIVVTYYFWRHISSVLDCLSLVTPQHRTPPSVKRPTAYVYDHGERLVEAVGGAKTSMVSLFFGGWGLEDID